MKKLNELNKQLKDIEKIIENLNKSFEPITKEIDNKLNILQDFADLPKESSFKPLTMEDLQ